jgi:hypothetical protein
MLLYRSSPELRICLLSKTDLRLRVGILETGMAPAIPEAIFNSARARRSEARIHCLMGIFAGYRAVVPLTIIMKTFASPV